MNMNRALVLFLASTICSGALAATVTVDAGNYSITYDESFWGAGSFSQSGHRFTFANLVNTMGTSAGAASDYPYTRKVDAFTVQDGWIPPLLITADAGYKVKSVLAGGTGSMGGKAGVDPLNTKGSEAFSVVGMATDWFKDDSYSLASYEGFSQINRTYTQNVNALGVVENLVGTTGSFNESAVRTFSDNLTSVIGRFSAMGSVGGTGKGSWATAQIDSAYFSFNVVPITPVPEPETWAMFLGGLGLLGVFARRRNSTAH